MEIILIKGAQLILSLSILVILHELGHYIPAKLFGCRVEKFYLFFDWPFALFKKKIGETEFGVGAFPLGGYVKISGIVDESFDTEHTDSEPKEWEFRSKPAWQRLIILLGGVTINFILGFLLYMMIMFVWGKTVVSEENLNSGFKVSELMQEVGFEDGDKILTVDGKEIVDQFDINKMLFTRGISQVQALSLNGQRKTINIPEDIGTQMMESGQILSFIPIPDLVIDSVISDMPASYAGLQKGDIISRVNGSKILNPDDFDSQKSINADYIELEISRNGNLFDAVVPFDSDEKLIGINIGSQMISPTNLEYGFFESVSVGFDYGYWTLYDYVSQFQFVFTKAGASQLGGFGTIGKIFPAAWDWQRFWETTALLSIILAFMNLLPIPALDGGHVMFVLYEIVSGRKPNEKFMEYATLAGVILLIGLFVYANGMDVVRAVN
ncbi:MAG: RIP metalloprotease RseP [Cryomorphaceae bacterium]|nr:MAG: RIP metalloprotease RseP [Cryomorphaceae bacterium]